MPGDTRERWHDRPSAALTTQLHTEVQQGLSPGEAAQRLQQQGPNALRQAARVSPLTLLAGQFNTLVIWVLIGAALVSVALGEVVDGSAILGITGDIAVARTAAFSVLVIEGLLRALSMRSDTRPIWHVGLRSNLLLCAIVLISVAVHVAAVSLPVLRTLFGVAPVSLGQWICWIGFTALPCGLLAGWKVLRHTRGR
ncbi:MAG: hypothetical protein FJZ47_07380 [Candidatus Tectomicrobia bacterium]|uniref:Cation-transporting P-type ATPase N-terminal domain-containing protein n=1 Tax=Tectimicrobiota bacterium TaxID=2528274 RepID=A0A938B1Y6_UNCTE|nr:hypothetical protein [Candidatus Tectomicrobia bacterium]